MFDTVSNFPRDIAFIFHSFDWWSSKMLVGEQDVKLWGSHFNYNGCKKLKKHGPPPNFSAPPFFLTSLWQWSGFIIARIAVGITLYKSCKKKLLCLYPEAFSVLISQGMANLQNTSQTNAEELATYPIKKVGCCRGKPAKGPVEKPLNQGKTRTLKICKFI